MSSDADSGDLPHLAASAHVIDRWRERAPDADCGPVTAYQDGREIDTAKLPGVDTSRARWHAPTDTLLLSEFEYVDGRRVIVTVIDVETASHRALREAVRSEVGD